MREGDGAVGMQAVQDEVGQREKRYLAYVCPAAASGVCKNKRRIPEEWLRETVINALLSHLFPDMTDGMTSQTLSNPKRRPIMDGIQNNPVFAEIFALVEQEQGRLRNQRPSRTNALQDEKRCLQQQLQGWAMSLSRPDLPEPVRRDLESQSAQAHGRIVELGQELLAEEILDQRNHPMINAEDVAKSLKQLETILRD